MIISLSFSKLYIRYDILRLFRCHALCRSELDFNNSDEERIMIKKTKKPLIVTIYLFIYRIIDDGHTLCRSELDFDNSDEERIMIKKN
jgi:hypothetical protein